MGKDASAQNSFEGDAVDSVVNVHERFKDSGDGPEQGKAKKKKGTRERRRRSKSAKQAELDAMPVVPPLVVEAVLRHQGVAFDNPAEGSLSSAQPVFQEAPVEKSELVQEEDELPDFENKDELPDFEIVNAPVPYGIEEAALHQRAKALGLPDSLEPHTPIAKENGSETKAEPILPVLQEAALHQRAKVLGLLMIHQDSHQLHLRFHRQIRPKRLLLSRRKFFIKGKTLSHWNRMKILWLLSIQTLRHCISPMKERPIR